VARLTREIRRVVTPKRLLSSKLLVPEAAIRLVSRPRLYGMLDAVPPGGVAAVVAPAGSGKTMLLASWIGRLRPIPPVAWLSLDAADNNPSLFWSYLIEALRRGCAAASGARLWDGVDGRAADDELLPAMLDVLARAPEPVLIVLDDLHEITNPRIAAGLERLLRRSPPTARWLLASRAVPPLPLSRLRVAGRLVEIRHPALACTTDEAAALFADLGLTLPPERLALVLHRTEGWVSGLRLAGLWLRDQPDPSAAAGEIGGNERFVADYMLDEVLARQPADVRDFLLRTSVPDRITGDLADTLTGRRDGTAVLGALEQANVFLLAVGPRREWFRYHSLLLDVLRRELRRTRSRQEVAALHRLAAAWFAERGLLADALGHAIDGMDWPHAAQLLVDDQLRAFLDGRAEALRPLLLRLPESLPESDPELALVFAVARLTAADPDGADVFLSLSEHVPDTLPADRRLRLGLLRTALRLLQSAQHGGVDMTAVQVAARALADRAEAVPDHGYADALAILHVNLGMAQLWSGAHEAARLSLDRGLHRLSAIGYDLLELEAQSAAALLDALAGHLRAAEETGRRTVAIGESTGWTGAASGAYLALVLAALERDELADASGLLAQIDQLAVPPAVAALAGLVRARLLAAGGDPIAAQRLLTELRAQPSGATAALLRGCALLGADLHMREGQPVPAARALGPVLATAATDRTAVEAAAVARLRLAEGDPPAALDAVAHVLDLPAGKSAPLGAVAALLAAAVAHRRMRAPAAAADCLGDALELAGPERLLRVFLDAGAEVRALLTTAVAPSSPHAELRTVLLHRFDGLGTAPPPAGWHPVEELTERELEVLRYLPSLLGNQEIASDLFVSVNTVKAHLKALYRKLEVTTRRDAVARAQQLHLL
jgi:LuxR family transcriptional regulator, maltose regulon positive regulatory protein